MWSNISVPKSGSKTAQADQENEHQFPPLMRFKHAVCSSSTSGHIYIHGGRFSNGVPLDDDLWRFDPRANSWLRVETRGCRPPSLQEHTLVEHGDQLYLFGGQVGSASGQENFFWRLDLLSNEWTSLNMKSSLRSGCNLWPTQRRSHSACLYRNSIYIFGGFEDFRGSSNQLWQYDLLNQRWRLCNLSSPFICHPEARHSHSAVWHQDSMYIYGGLSDLKPLSDLWRWSWRDQRWFKEKTRGHGPGALHGHSACQAFGSMFVFGGERQNGRTTRSLWRLDLSNLCWHKIKTKGPQPDPTTWHAAVANPMSVFDETNYLIENIDQERQMCQEEELTLFGNQQHQFPPMQTIPPTSNQTITRVKVCKSSPEQQIAAARSHPARPKRLLGLNFLLRMNKRANYGLVGEAESIPTSKSGPSTQDVAKNEEDIEMTTVDDHPGQQPVKQEQDSREVGILGRLEEDIKEMFERAMSPQQEEQEIPIRSNSKTSAFARDSWTQSQLSSYLAQTPTQTFQTASEHLTSQSTLIPLEDHGESSADQRKLVDVRQRRSMYQFKQRFENDQKHSGAGRNPRPRSETVQSLIARADARIKHLYTPHFSIGQQTSRATAANREHRSSNGSKVVGQILEQSNKHPAGVFASGQVTDYKSKRHTIHQSMTYYSLYFAERGGSSSGEGPKSPSDQRHEDTASRLTGGGDPATCSVASSVTMGNDESYKGRAENDSTTAALEGVRHTGGNSSSSSSSRLESEVAISMQSSESHTLCNCSNDDTSAASLVDQTINNNNNQQQSGTSNSPISQLLNEEYQGDDSTSMSISMITELEEDDMLQYSSEPSEHASKREPSSTSQMEGQRVVEIMQQDKLASDALENNQPPMGPDERTELGPVEREPMPTNKSISSGYESLVGGERCATDTQASNTSCSGKLEGGTTNCTTAHSTTVESLALTNSGSSMKSVPSSPATTASSRGYPLESLGSSSGGKKQSLASRLIFGRKRPKTRYWQLCMFVLGGKQQGGGQHGGTANANEPMTIWRLYI